MVAILRKPNHLLEMLPLCDVYLPTALSDFEQFKNSFSTHLTKHPFLLKGHQQIPLLLCEFQNESKLVDHDHKPLENETSSRKNSKKYCNNILHNVTKKTIPLVYHKTYNASKLQDTDSLFWFDHHFRDDK